MIQTLCKMKVNVKLNSETAILDLLVVSYDGPALFGRDWLGKLRLSWQEVKTLRAQLRVIQRHKMTYLKHIRSYFHLESEHSNTSRDLLQ